MPIFLVAKKPRLRYKPSATSAVVVSLTLQVSFILAILLCNEAKVLLFKIEDGRDFYLLPGGKIKFNEDSINNPAGEGGYLKLLKSGVDFSNGFTFEFYGNLSRAE